MKLNFTLASLCMLLLINGISAQTLIWGGPGDPNSEFDGGLNDWTTVGVASNVPDSAANAIWIWDADGIGDMGSFWGNGAPIASPSVANGVALFDSDFLDNAGTGIEGLGTGSAPSPHTGELISPVIDLSDEPLVVVSFYQKYRNFDSQCFVSVSGDGGNTFTDFQVNGDVDGSINNQEIVNISSVAGGQDSVIIKFKFVGDYYYWMIDDVALITLPAVNLELVDGIRSPFYTPASAVAPSCAFEQDTFFFSTRISNLGSDTLTNVVYKATVSNFDTEEVLFADSVILDMFPSFYSDSVVSTPNTYAPEGLAEGAYRIEHSVYSIDSPDDFDMTNNSASQFFVVDNMQFAKEYSGASNSGLWDPNGLMAVGVIYTLGTNCMENYVLSNVQYSIGRVGADPDPLAGRETQIWVWEMLDGLATFDASVTYDEAVSSVAHPSMNFIAFSQDMVTEDDLAEDLITADEPFLNFDGDETRVKLEPGKSYGIFSHWGLNGQTPALFLFASEHESNTDLFYTQTNGWGGGFSNSNSAPILRANLEIESTVDDKPLSNESFKVYPNPASEMINLEVNLERSSNATITIATINGQVITYQDHANIRNERISINVSEFPSGSYLARIATEEGTKTLKFIVE